MNRILVPVDFSEQSLNAINFAYDIVQKSKGRIVLAHVLALPVLHSSPIHDIDGFRKPLIDEIKQVTCEKLGRLVNQLGIPEAAVECKVVLSNHLQEAIVEEAQNRYDLIVMGTKGSSGLREWMFGSNTEKIVRNSPVPVIAVKEYEEGNTIRNIVFPNTLDTENQEELIMKVKALQNFFDATIHIIWVNTPSLFRDEQELRTRLNDFAHRFMLKNYTVNIFNYSSEEEGIMEFTRQIEADMIAMGTHGLRGLAHAISGSVAEDVVNHVPYPVWTWSTRQVDKPTLQVQ